MTKAESGSTLYIHANGDVLALCVCCHKSKEKLDWGAWSISEAVIIVL